MPPVISIAGLGKKYRIRHRTQESYVTFRDALAGGAKGLVRRMRPFSSRDSQHPAREEFWALSDVSFDVQKGDRIGIVGRNGAGKSTLLKLISRITEPSTGQIKIKGRLASLLEVGTGFHPELTGRENIYLNGAILGMSKAEIKRKFDAIVAFAEVEKFLDTPVKRYSSGMYVRLAFAVSAHLEPDVLVIDEVLSVGDSAFQKKCLGKMQDEATQGRTILFVSHNMGTVNALCNKGIFLNGGRIAASGAVENVMAEYMQHNASSGGHHFVNRTAEAADAKANVLEAWVLGPEGEPNAAFFVDQCCFIRIVWRLNVRVPFLRFGVEISDSSGVLVVSSMDTDSTDLLGQPRKPGNYDAKLELSAFTLMPGHYSVKIFAGMPGIERIMEFDHLLQFEVLDNHTHLSHVAGERRSGYVPMPLNWEVRYKDAEQNH